MFLLTFLNRRSPKSWFHSLREIRMSVGNVSDDKRFSFGGTARAVLRARRRGPRLAEAGRIRTNSRLESRCRDASVRTRARAGCLACLPSASFEVCPFSFLYYYKSWRAAIFRKYARYCDTHRYRCNFIIIFDWRYNVTKNVRTFSISTSEWLDELVARVTLECDCRRARVYCRHAVRLSLDRFPLCSLDIRNCVQHFVRNVICLCSSRNHLGGRDGGEKRTEGVMYVPIDN